MAVPKVDGILSLYDTHRDNMEKQAQRVRELNKKHTSQQEELTATETEITEGCRKLTALLNCAPQGVTSSSP
jgi:hypothetical protein